MTVKHGLLAILTLGTAYGLQLRDELVIRAPHRAGINVGQVYGTLERLRAAGLVADSGFTDDNLQLYELTPRGHEAVATWIRRPAQGARLDWSEMLDQILVTSSLPGAPLAELTLEYRNRLAEWSAYESAESAPQRAGAVAATALLSRAAGQWLDGILPILESPSASYDLSRLRPRRGRRSLVTDS